MTKTETGAPWLWSAALILAGGLVGIAYELTVGVYAFHIADRTVMVWGQPVDALNKVALGVLAGVIAFGGAAVTAYLATHDRAALRRQAKIALLVTLCASCVAVYNGASAFAWYRRSAEAPQIAQTEQYKQAVLDYRATSARLAGEPLGYEEEEVVYTAQQKAAKIVKSGQKPTGNEPPGIIDVLRAIIAHLLCIAPAAAYRLPPPRAAKKSKRPTGRRAAKPKLVVTN